MASVFSSEPATVRTKMKNSPKVPQRPRTPVRPGRRAALAAVPAVAVLALLGGRPGQASAASVATVKPSISAFDSVLIDVPADVTISIGKPAAVAITAEQKVLDVIVAEVTDGQLSVRTNGSFQTDKPVTIAIDAPELIALEALGSCQIEVAGPLTGELNLIAHDATTVTLNAMNLSALIADLQGSSEVQADGSAANLELTVAGASTFSAPELAVSTASLEVSGSSEANVDVAKNLDVTITDAGSVFYTGSPSIKKSVSFAGTFESQ